MNQSGISTEPKQHALLSPSSAARWLTCPGSVHLEVATGRAPVYSEAAEVGTVEHLMLESWIRNAIHPAEWTGKKLGEHAIEVTAEMAARVESACAWLLRYVHDGQPIPYLRPEERLPTYLAFDVGPEVIFGTADVVSWRGYGEALVFDYKGGFVPVDVTTSHQLRLYAIGLQASAGWTFDKVRLVIFQPKCGGASEFTINRDELLSLVPWYKERIDRALDPLADLVPSEAGCRFCPGAGVCPALHEESVALAKQEFLSPASLTVEQIAEVLTKAPRIRAALEAVESNAIRLLTAGATVPGWKLVEGQKHRKWKDEASEERLRASLRTLGFKQADYEPRKLLSPNQIEKLVGPKGPALVEPLSVKPKGEPSLAPESDKRPALRPEFAPVDKTTSSR